MISKQAVSYVAAGALQEKSTDTYYLSLANRLAAIAKDKGLFPHYPEKAVERAALPLWGTIRMSYAMQVCGVHLFQKTEGCMALQCLSMTAAETISIMNLIR